MPERMILSQVRQMVEEMQALNKKRQLLMSISSPLTRRLEIVMKMQLEGEEKAMREMVKTMQSQALLEKTEAERLANVTNSEANQHVQEKVPTSSPLPRLK
ncbi:hypothetical protein RHMOL_Rhmol09G0075600 [Rhododendron molle]|uniref:Uncharacterized protein n=1 Tax=Rhododendron molle TaxID=49168 RepID=A0ACC0MAN4_RHOML|nr:hypothetical protein RHMOL_Rhmol09G0075600 [Rhododendron molle]